MPHDDYRVRDYVATPEHLVFAIVAEGQEAGRLACFLRYVARDGGLQKLDTHQANAWLESRHPEYLFDSPLRQARLHGVPGERIVRHFSARDRARRLSGDSPDALERIAAQFLAACGGGAAADLVGVSGSLLLGAHHAESDIDVVFYDAALFHQARREVSRRAARREAGWRALEAADWRVSHRRRGGELTLAEYVAHETRKANKVLLHGVKVDLSLVRTTPWSAPVAARKLRRISLEAEVVDDQYAFDTPAAYAVAHPLVDHLLAFTPTYVGQARAGERVAASGWLEERADGTRQLVIGASREAPGEWLRKLP